MTLNQKPYSAEGALRDWAISTNQTYGSVAIVMEIVRNVSSCKLPKDARTLLKVKRNISTDMHTVEGGQYFHCKLQECLTKQLRYVFRIVTVFCDDDKFNDNYLQWHISGSWRQT